MLIYKNNNIFCNNIAVVILFNVISVNVKKIIDLINSNKKSEKVKLKNPILCIIVFGISVAALIYAYMMVTDQFSIIRYLRKFGYR